VSGRGKGGDGLKIEGPYQEKEGVKQARRLDKRSKPEMATEMTIGRKGSK
jgi:hypothetical protein